jgi:hypothetical protein
LNKIIDDYKNFDEKFSGVGGNNEEVWWIFWDYR